MNFVMNYVDMKERHIGDNYIIYGAKERLYRSSESITKEASKFPGKMMKGGMYYTVKEFIRRFGNANVCEQSFNIKYRGLQFLFKDGGTIWFYIMDKKVVDRFNRVAPGVCSPGIADIVMKNLGYTLIDIYDGYLEYTKIYKNNHNILTAIRIMNKTVKDIYAVADIGDEYEPEIDRVDPFIHIDYDYNEVYDIDLLISNNPLVISTKVEQILAG